LRLALDGEPACRRVLLSQASFLHLGRLDVARVRLGGTGLGETGLGDTGLGDTGLGDTGLGDTGLWVGQAGDDVGKVRT
jgi:hypothetical protein